VLVISSELPELLAVGDRILVLRDGELVAEVDGATATEEEIIGRATGAGRTALLGDHDYARNGRGAPTADYTFSSGLSSLEPLVSPTRKRNRSARNRPSV
jgi:hypothetical protein